VTQGRVDFARSGFQGFASDRPLLKLANYQARLAADIDGAVAGRVEVPRFVGGVDLSYVPARNMAVAAFVELDLDSWEVSYEKLACRPVSFPYISSYLAFRELPLLLELMDKVRRDRELPRVVMVDGSGILHPRRAGIAAMLGAVADVTTVGVTKKHLAGQVEIRGMQSGEARRITLHGRLCGYALLPGSGTHKPLYVSPGAGIDATSALTLVERTLRGRRLPEPIYWADRLSRERAKSRSPMPDSLIG
jgi:deoxyribonuclease V